MKQYKPVLFMLMAAIFFYAVHKILSSTVVTLENPVYTIEELFLFFTICSIIILTVLVKISQKSFDNVGMVFLILTSLKMIFCYLMLRPILIIADETLRIQKISFFILFILFLAIETVITIRILNNKQ